MPKNIALFDIVGVFFILISLNVYVFYVLNKLSLQKQYKWYRRKQLVNTTIKRLHKKYE